MRTSRPAGGSVAAGAELTRRVGLDDQVCFRPAFEGLGRNLREDRLRVVEGLLERPS